MHKRILFIMILSVVFVSGYTQQIPVVSCGIVYHYNESGNCTKGLYCNNEGNPYSTRSCNTANSTHKLESYEKY